MISAKSCTATFELLPPDTFSLTVAKTGTGSGTVTSSPAGIDCGPDCNETYDDGTTVTLTATPATGSAFAGWSGAADCADGSVTVTSDLACTATFTLETRPLTVARSGSGSGTITSTPAGIDCGTDCAQDYDYGTNVTLTATPDASSSFTGWSGDADCSDGSVTMTSAKSCTATFELLPPDTYSLTVAKTGTGSGTVSSSPAGIDCGPTATKPMKTARSSPSPPPRLPAPLSQAGPVTCRLHRRLCYGHHRPRLHRHLHPRDPAPDGRHDRHGQRHGHQLTGRHRLRHRLQPGLRLRHQRHPHRHPQRQLQLHRLERRH